MIKNERQRQLASEQVEKLRRALNEIENRPRLADEHPARRAMELSAVQGQIDELSRDVEDYRMLRDGLTPVGAVRDLSALPQVLIRQRIASGLTQKQLAERLGVKEQQVQRDEANDYASASLDRLERVAKALGISADIPSSSSSVPSIPELLAKLEAAGLDKRFLQRRLVSKVIRTDKPGAVMPALDFIGRVARVFSWPASSILSGGDLMLPRLAVNYKEPANAAPSKTRVYTAYAHFCASLTLSAIDTVPREFPVEARELGIYIERHYHTLTFRSILEFAWDHGIAVLPMDERGGFHAAVFRFSDRRSAIILKQTERYRWAFDLLHEIAHLMMEPSGELIFVDEGEGLDTDVERRASSFAASVLLRGRDEELTERVLEDFGGDLTRFKIAVLKAAKAECVSPAALAEHIAFLYQQSGQGNIWDHAHNLAKAQEREDPLQVALDALYKRLHWDRLGQIDREILNQALSAVSS